jgi:4-hydroxybenzoate polyprenyltransferase
MLIGYGLIFFNLAFPSLIILNSPVDKEVFFSGMFKKSLLNSIHTFGPIPSDPYALFLQQTSIFMSRCYWIMTVLTLLTILYLAYRPVWNAWVKNLRPERVLYYSMIAIFGMSISYRVNGSFPVFTLPDIIAFIIFFTLIALSFWLAVIINDIEDIEIDKISNPGRPLITKNISIEQFKTIGFVILFLILMGAPLLNYPVFIFLILFQFMYYIYSKKPLYLKRWFFLASPLLAFNALLIAMAGFFLISANQKILAFPIETIWFMLIGFSIVTNLKDIKDIEGDRAAGIKTLPVIFGQEKAKKIITIAAIIFILIFAVYKQNSYLIFSSVIISALFYLITSRKIFKETYIFGLFFLYLMVIMLA